MAVHDTLERHGWDVLIADEDDGIVEEDES